MKTIVEYEDYRDFILDKLQERKKKSKVFSFQLISSKLGTTKSYLKLVVDKKRQISLEKVVPICKLFKLTDFELQYFIFLYLKNIVKDQVVKTFFEHILKSYRAYEREPPRHESSTVVKDDINYLFRNWVSMAIMGLADFHNYEHTPEWIQKMLGGPQIISLLQVRRSMDMLVEKKFLIREKSAWRPQTNRFVSDLEPFDIEDFQRFKIGLNRAALSLDYVGKSMLHRPSRYQMHYLTLDEQSLEKVMKLYDQFEKKIIKISHQVEKANRVVFVSNNIFCVSEEQLDQKK